MVMPKSISEDPRYAGRLFDMATPADIPDEWKGTPVEKLILSENFETPIEETGKPEILIVTCIEFRYQLPIPSMFAFVIRRASGRLIGSEFSLAYTLYRGVECVALIGHNDCGMTKVLEAKEGMRDALVKHGWHELRAEEFIQYHAGRYGIGDEIDSLEREYWRLKRLFPNLLIAPMFVCLADKKLYVPNWYLNPKPTECEGETLVRDEDLLTIM